ncbi:MAG: diguanylate cyclase, partial [Candidatus Obscuribacterales bacterium]|nr:diguanylate cyclase [Candidatus Obscuribacterales bacterium]
GMIAGVLRALVRAETGMYTYPALQYFIEREFSKCIAFGMPLSLIVFEARIILGGDPPQPLPIPALREICTRVEAMKRPFDIVAHHETFEFALLLPGATSKAARMFANKVAESLINVPLMQGQTQRLLLAGGIASSPEDTQDLGRFLAAAREAKSKAKDARVPLKAFSEL